eukprot:gene18005-21486_t
MGYKGQGGLGADGSGIVEPLQSYVRPVGAGLSYVHEQVDKRFNQQPKSDDEDDDTSDDEDEEEEEEKTKATGWRKKKEKAGKKTTGSSLADVVLDMRGPQATLRAGASEAATATQEDGGPLAQLKYNIALLIRMREMDAHNASAKLVHERRQVESLSNSVTKLKLTCDADTERISRTRKCLEIILGARGALDESRLTLDALYRTCVRLQTQFTQEYRKLRLYKLVDELLRPLIQIEINRWDIGAKPGHLVDEMIRWRTLLEGGESEAMNQGGDVYFVIMRDLFMPVFKLYIRTKWSVREDAGRVVALVGFWSAAMPPVILDTLLEHAVLPRLRSEVAAWSPATDPIPIDSWMHPWLPFLRVELEALYPGIRQTLISTLSAWQAGDLSARTLLEPWKQVFEGNSMDSLLNRAIVPKFEAAFKAAQYSPAASEEDDTSIVAFLIEWDGLLPIQTMLGVLERSFFPRWLAALVAALQEKPSRVTDERLLTWYSVWKASFKSIWEAGGSRLKSPFSISLDLIDRSSRGLEVQMPNLQPQQQQPNAVAARQQQSAQTRMNREKEAMISKIKGKSDVRPNPHDDQSIRESLEDLASTLGHLFAPTGNTSSSGHQIYEFGSIPIVLDKGVIFFHDRLRGLEPANIQTLLDRVNNK